jgi:hypothetical protein
MSPLPNERAAVGRSRIPVCQALKDRALRLLDTHGIMRRPSLEGLKSLLLLSNLMMGEIPKGWEEGQDAEMDREVSDATCCLKYDRRSDGMLTLFLIRRC